MSHLRGQAAANQLREALHNDPPSRMGIALGGSQNGSGIHFHYLSLPLSAAAAG